MAPFKSLFIDKFFIDEFYDARPLFLLEILYLKNLDAKENQFNALSLNFAPNPKFSFKRNQLLLHLS